MNTWQDTDLQINESKNKINSHMKNFISNNESIKT